ncbi:EAL domain-containing protein [Niveibacterium sp. 24ML]|uniref:putative bifunctional diguanylate cyclase/phosphodiesterase n=1 Tax=Niveibacterium sp. 24ML TaxID=2985512 RepID=UPI0022720924|nr:bifunctional diguanylate cyclase/phosphodiesterase [Niveibacterium sp. 24ML]MCX9157220.1 EAL domain-containing protein [Niveibacterium sp. 24ML]
MKPDKCGIHAAELRRQAESRLAAGNMLAPGSEAESRRLVHELQVHQIELEMQNEQLQLVQNELEQARNRYATLYEDAPVGYLSLSANGLIQELNRRAATMLGVERSALVGCQFEALVSAEDQPLWRLALAGILRKEAGSRQSTDLALRLPDGGLLQTQVDYVRVSKADAALRITLTDIGERKRAEARMRLSASVFAHCYDGIMIVDVNGLIVDINPAFTRITGYSRDEVLGQRPSMLASGRHESEFYAAMWASLREHDFWQGEIWNRRKNGEAYAEKLSISTIRDEQGKLQQYVGICSDITSSKVHEAELDRIAHFDVLTGVPNRRLLIDRLDRAIVHAQRGGKLLAVCYLDLDGFKPINDLYGHGVGDELLIVITKRLQDQLRGEDTIARIGGDEFVLLLNDLLHPHDVEVTLERLLTVVAAPVQIEERSLSVSASIGVTLYPSDDVDADPLLRHADQAMYQAKETGKNRFYLFDPVHSRQAQAHRSQLLRLREALDHKEFVLFYQPKVDLVSGEVVGAEALIRWQHPEKGLLQPGDFLGYLAGSSLEPLVGEWVIESVLSQIAAWNSIGFALMVSANISADHLLLHDFADRLSIALARHPEVAPHSLELEILESAALSDMSRAAEVLNCCKQLGVRFALDDFGTGYSSLTYFQKLPIDALKIDRSFVCDMLHDKNDFGIVEIVVRLAKAFNCSVIAEGVETLEHGAALVELGCRLAQGYGIARPMPADQFVAWASEWQSKGAWHPLH